MKLERSLLIVFFVLWVVALSATLGLVTPPRPFTISLRVYFALAAATGWLAGNVYVQRTRGVPGKVRRRLVWAYLAGPPALTYVVWEMQSDAVRNAAPLAPVWATAVMLIFFLVPVTFRRSGRPRPSR